MSTLRLDTPIKFLKGIGERRAELFYKLGVETAQDLLWHLPHRYLDASAVTPLAEALVGNEYACVGKVVAKRVVPFKRLRVFRAVLRDDSGVLECVWPGQAFLDRTIREGQTLLVTGPVRFYHGRQMVPREFVVLDEPDEEAEGRKGAGAQEAPTHDARRATHDGRVLPIYPATEGLSHKTIRALIDRHLDALITLAADPVPPAVLKGLDLPPVAEALRDVHRPKDIAEAERGRRRLAFDELFDLQLTLARARSLAKQARAGIKFEPQRDLTTRLRESLPWELTAGQKQALKEIVADMGSTERMHRLLMGDVGTGKTVVSLFAMLLAVENGYQTALMAPTELLAEQHVRTLTALLEPLDIVPELVLGRQSPAEKQAARKRLADGSARIVVGTHALFQEAVTFRKLGLVVIDEQHRFGVEQRAALIGKGSGPDVLLLTATPIPRSLALTLYGDLDVSTLRERPPGRGGITTAVRTAAGREKVWAFVHDQLGDGRQAYVVLPIIDESEKADLRAATTMAEELTVRWPDVEVGLVHGRLKAEERDEVMRRFRAGKVQCLVSTTVIEVGIDVPNATVMVIDHPERFGLAQLHQLRGRVGRGGNASHCILLAEGRVPPRLKAFAATEDGFKIAELDLQERGMGDLIGARQSGGITIRHAKLPDDTDLLQRARESARDIIAADANLLKPAHQPLRARALLRYPRAVELFRVG
jgi:ATP-dependent DNA helicase RecG